MELRLSNFWIDEQGQDITEYTLMLAVVVVILLVLAAGFQGSIGGITSTTNMNLAAASRAAT